MTNKRKIFFRFFVYIFFSLGLLFFFHCQTSNTFISKTSDSLNQSSLLKNALQDFLSEIDGDSYISEKYKTLYLYINPDFITSNLHYFIWSDFEDLITQYRFISLIDNKNQSDLFLDIQVHDFLELEVEHNILQEPTLFKLYISLQLDLYDQLITPRELLHTYSNVRYQIWYSKEELLQFGHNYWFQQFSKGMARRLFLLFLSGWYTEEKSLKELNHSQNNKILNYKKNTENIRLPKSWTFEQKELFLRENGLLKYY